MEACSHNWIEKQVNCCTKWVCSGCQKIWMHSESPHSLLGSIRIVGESVWSSEKGYVNPYILGSAVTVAATPSNCMAGTYVFSWTGDYPGSTTTACNSAGAALSGTLVGGAVVSTDYGEVGDKGLQVNATNKFIIYIATAGVTPSAAQTLWMRVFLSAAPTANTEVFKGYELPTASTTYISLSVQTDRSILGTYRNPTINVTAAGPSLLSISTWTDIGYSWDPPNQDHSTAVGTTWDEDLNEITTTTSTVADRIVIGNFSSSNPGCEIRIRQMAIVNGYQASKPSGW